jgi:hypothetical protein
MARNTASAGSSSRSSVARAQASILTGLEGVAREADGLDAIGAGERRRGEQEAQCDPARPAGRRLRGIRAEDLDVAPGGGVGGGIGERVGERELGRVDEDVGVGQVAELAQLRVREGGLFRAAPGDDDDLADTAAGQHVERVIGDIGAGELGASEDQHPGDVERHVAGADHDDALAAQLELVVAEVRVSVVPADEVGGRVAPAQLLAGDPHRAVGRCPHRVDDRVVVAAVVGERQVLAELDVGEQPQSRVLRRALVQVCDRLDLRVVGGDAGADETPRGWQALVEVHVHLARCVAQEVPGGIAAGRPRPDDRDANLGVVGIAHPREPDVSGMRTVCLTRPCEGILRISSIRADTAPLP